MIKYIFDLEGDSLNPTKIHVVSYAKWTGEKWEVFSITDYDRMKQFFSQKGVMFIGHNIVQFDIPAVSKILGVKIDPSSKIVDTLALSWYLYPQRKKYGIEFFAEDFGLKKPEITDWENLSLEKYVHRCQEDVRITTYLWSNLYNGLIDIYGSDEKLFEFSDYLTFKMKCAHLAESSKWKLDVELCRKNLSILETELEEKKELLKNAMPKIPVIKLYTRPAKMYNKNGDLSKDGNIWLAILHKHGYPEDAEENGIQVVEGYTESNPGSTIQVKEWLTSLGWKPITFKEVKDKKTGGNKSIPQITRPNKELCESVKELIDIEPAVQHLVGVTVLTARIGVLKGFLKNVDADGFLKARVAGLTNTLRFKHAELVNMPKPNSLYGEYIRSCLIAREGYELLGSDMSALEDKTKQHYIYPLDPNYVQEMMSPDFDPHLSLAQFSGALTEEQVKAHKEKREDHSKIRNVYKTCNYLLTYGGGVDKLAKAADIKKGEASKIKTNYWKKNWAVKQVAMSWTTKVTKSGTWIYNPVSGFWYSLRSEKDRFSTINSSTGVYCFDSWIKEVLSKREQLTAQFHDEIVLEIKKGHREEAKALVIDAINRVNEKLKLNILLGIGVQFGDNYSEIH